MSPNQAAKRLQTIGQRAVKAGESALQKAQEKVYQDALEQSSGGHSEAELRSIARRRGAGVYSRRRPDNRFDPAKVNKQSGEFARGWHRGTPYYDSRGDYHAPVVNTSRKAGLFDGQPHGYMRGRPIGEKIRAKAARVIDMISALIRRSIK